MICITHTEYIYIVHPKNYTQSLCFAMIRFVISRFFPYPSGYLDGIIVGFIGIIAAQSWGIWVNEWNRLLNSLAPGRSGCDFKNTIFILVLLADIFRSSHDNALRWMPQYFTGDKSTLVQVMAWCRQATSHYLCQCQPRSLSPYGVTKPQCVNAKDANALELCFFDNKPSIWMHNKLIPPNF